jgi:hypothetical protein
MRRNKGSPSYTSTTARRHVVVVRFAGGPGPGLGLRLGLGLGLGVKSTSSCLQRMSSAEHAVGRKARKLRRVLVSVRKPVPSLHWQVTVNFKLDDWF